MTIVEQERTYPGPIGTVASHAWTPAITGALVATALSITLVAFGAAVGLGVVSAAPTWRDASVALWLLSGIYLILVALVSFGAGGYVAGRMGMGLPVTSSSVTAPGIEHGDGLNGLAAWAIAVVASVLITAVVGSVTLSRAPSTRAEPSLSAAEPMLSYELDRLFRPARRAANGETPMERAEAGRILLTSSSHSGVSSDDRSYLVQLVSGVTGLAGPDAERRVDNNIANAKTAIAQSRRSAIIVAFSIAVSVLLGAVVAWFAAGEGSRHRGETVAAGWTGNRYEATTTHPVP